MNQKDLLVSLSDYKSDKTEEIYLAMLQLYQETFGGPWLKKELKEAMQIIKTRKQVNRSMTFAAIMNCFQTVEDSKGPLFIGTKEVSQPNYVAYSKGLYWMAGYNLLNNL